MTAATEINTFLSSLQGDLKEQFERERTLLSFEEYLEVVQTTPHAQARDAAMYVKDTFDYFGTREITRPYGTFTRFNLFDAPFDQGIDSVAGQEAVQQQIYGFLCDFIREGRVNKLILLNGPNGSAKSTIINCIQRALEHYSAQDEGALYSFNWVFPAKRKERGGIGFGQNKGMDHLDSFAHLSANEIDARIQSEVRDHPLLLIPKEERVSLLKSLLGDGTDLPKSLVEGDLSPKSARIFDALLKSYQGDITEVFRHVQVERFTISRRYRRALSTVDPQLRADAVSRQITADRSLSALPVTLQHLNLFEPSGHLVEANRGIVEYNDLLKRPVETFKYLLSTCEKGAIRLDHMTLFLDVVFIGSCNVQHLQAFKEIPDFASFKGRIELVRVPYLRDVELETQIYLPQVQSLRRRAYITPDVIPILARWAVMTRLERPQPFHYHSDHKELIEKLTALDKSQLYSKNRAPDHCSIDERKVLLQIVKPLYQETPVESMYEGWFGASPREIKTLLLSLGRPEESSAISSITNRQSNDQQGDQSEDQQNITPLSVFKALRELCTQESVYPFLRRKPSGSYYQPKSFIDQLEDLFFQEFDDRLHESMGLVSASASTEMFQRYLDELTYAVRGEKKQNIITGQYEDPNERFMCQIEDRLKLGKDRTQARGELIQRIAKWRLENTEGEIDYAFIFIDELKLLQESYFEEKRQIAQDRLQELISYTQGQLKLDEESKRRAQKTLDCLNTEYGYTESCALQVIYALRQRSSSL